MLVHPEDRPLHQLASIEKFQFSLDVRAVGIDSLGTQSEGVGNAPRFKSFSEKFKNLKFSS